MVIKAAPHRLNRLNMADYDDIEGLFVEDPPDDAQGVDAALDGEEKTEETKEQVYLQPTTQADKISCPRPKINIGLRYLAFSLMI